MKPEARISTIAGEDGTDNGADMLVKSDSLTHASDKIDERRRDYQQLFLRGR